MHDNDKERQSSVRRIVGKAMLDTANYSDDFISFAIIEKLNAMHVCHEAPQAITVCSGFNGNCYMNNETNDLNLQFFSYDGECHAIPFTLRVNRNKDIELLLSRNTVNKYDFMSLHLLLLVSLLSSVRRTKRKGILVGASLKKGKR